MGDEDAATISSTSGAASPGVQHALPLLLDAGLRPRELATARRRGDRRGGFDSAAKGRVEVGADADLVLVDAAPTDDCEITADSLHYRHAVSPYVGRRLRARVRRTLVRGITVFDARPASRAPPFGRLLTPS